MRLAAALPLLLAFGAGCALGPAEPSVPPVAAPDGLPVVQSGEAVPAPLGMQYVPSGSPPAPLVPLTNPLRVPVVDRDFAWDQIVSVMQEYFKIEHEERVRLVGNILTEGRIDMFPETTATLLEPWRGDAVTRYDKLEATLQSMRHRAFVRVVPDQGSFLIELTVLKELEDLPRPMMSTAGAAMFQKTASQERINGPLPTLNQPPGLPPQPAVPTVGWIGQGRDVNLEQVILAKILSRLTVAASPAFAAPSFGPPPVMQPQVIPAPAPIQPGVAPPGVLPQPVPY